METRLTKQALCWGHLDHLSGWYDIKRRIRMIRIAEPDQRFMNQKGNANLICACIIMNINMMYVQYIDLDIWAYVHFFVIQYKIYTWIFCVYMLYVYTWYIHLANMYVRTFIDYSPLNSPNWVPGSRICRIGSPLTMPLSTRGFRKATELLDAMSSKIVCNRNHIKPILVVLDSY